MKAVIVLRNGMQLHVEGTPEEIACLTKLRLPRSTTTPQRRRRRRPKKRLGFKL